MKKSGKKSNNDTNIWGKKDNDVKIYKKRDNRTRINGR
jgi:hypothetical protein